MTTATTTESFSAYRQERLRHMFAYITGEPCPIQVVKGNLAHHNERLLRTAIEKATGKKFIFGCDPTDPFASPSDIATHGWFLSDVDIEMVWTTEVHDDYEVLCADSEGNEYEHEHRVIVTTDPFGFTQEEWECDEFGNDTTSFITGFTPEGTI